MTSPRIRIGLGTAHFGTAGHEQCLGKATGMVEVAAVNGVTLIDTAAVYGESERLLGKSLNMSHEFRIITKTPPLREGAIGSRQIDLVKAAFERSLHRLGVAHVDGLLVHHANDLLVTGGDWLWDVLSAYKKQGHVSKLGVLVDNVDRLAAIRSAFDVDLIQLPLSVFDQRALMGGRLIELREAGIEVHARSPFFHGLLLRKVSDLPDRFLRLRDQLDRYHSVRLKHNLTAIKAALSFVMGTSVDCVIVNAARPNDFSAVLTAARSLPDETPDFAEFACTDLRLLNPTQWAA